MNLYLDDDSSGRLMVQTLRKAGHDVQLPVDVDMLGKPDPVHLKHAIHERRILVTANFRDFELLHDLLVEAGGRHPGIFVIRKDNNVRTDLKPHHVPRAIANLLASGSPIADQYIILNHWR